VPPLHSHPSCRNGRAASCRTVAHCHPTRYLSRLPPIVPRPHYCCHHCIVASAGMSLRCEGGLILACGAVTAGARCRHSHAAVCRVAVASCWVLCSGVLPHVVSSLCHISCYATVVFAAVAAICHAITTVLPHVVLWSAAAVSADCRTATTMLPQVVLSSHVHQAMVYCRMSRRSCICCHVVALLLVSDHHGVEEVDTRVNPLEKSEV